MLAFLRRCVPNSVWMLLSALAPVRAYPLSVRAIHASDGVHALRQVPDRSSYRQLASPCVSSCISLYLSLRSTQQAHVWCSIPSRLVGLIAFVAIIRSPL